MLLRNVNETYVNGSIGTVVQVSSDKIKVDFEGVVLTIEKYTFSKSDPVTGIALSGRHQFPLKVAYAITIHKSQGTMTLPCVEVNCKFATNPGQIGVAVGRAVSTDGLRVVNYSPTMLKGHPAGVYKFYGEIQTVSTALDSTECCKHEHIETQESRD
ncbi:hypothetical protein DPMN_089380 [Dreissena polymorpha]|uniref:Helicase n=1 Tax=Dreissena polymorpha TaxID=45954 RepID=A0A9D4QY55_DREPO|nr:hypothetical protein DPMN_089380 [Dreissena polymorpha]